MPTWTQADIDALKSSIRRGVLSTTVGDRTTTFQSLQAMRDLLAEMERTVRQSPAFRVAATSKDV